jgi:hypothetical protein
MLSGDYIRMSHVSCVERVGNTHSSVFTETKRKIFCKYYRQPTRGNNNNLLIIQISSTCFWRQSRPSSGAEVCAYSLCYNTPAMLPAAGLDAEELRIQANAGNNMGALYRTL